MSAVRALALVAAGGLVLASCSSDGGSGEQASASPSPTSTVSVPAGVDLTSPGSKLTFGEKATVIFEPTQKRGSVLELTVNKARQGSVKDFSAFILDDYTKKATPYYVNVAVKNVGEGDVGGVAVPLWGVDAKNTLLPAASFTTNFKKCPSEKLPKTFAAGDTLETCLVYLAPDKGTLKGVSFRPDQKFNPIRWAGTISSPTSEPSKKPSKKASNQG